MQVQLVCRSFRATIFAETSSWCAQSRDVASTHQGFFSGKMLLVAGEKKLRSDLEAFGATIRTGRSQAGRRSCMPLRPLVRTRKKLLKPGLRVRRLNVVRLPNLKLLSLLPHSMSGTVLARATACEHIHSSLTLFEAALCFQAPDT